MSTLIGFAIFALIGWFTTLILVQKGLGVWPSIVLALILLGIGRLCAVVIFATIVAAPEPPASKAVISAIMGLAVPALVPIGFALLMPARDSRAGPSSKIETVECTECGRNNAATTTICPRCGTRTA